MKWVSMLLGFKTQLRLNNKQRTLLAKHAGTARHAWNWGLGLTKQILDHNRDNPEDKIKFPTGIDLHKCSQCHTVKDSMPLSERVFRCDNCGLEIARDFNASINLEIAAS